MTETQTPGLSLSDAIQITGFLITVCTIAGGVGLFLGKVRRVTEIAVENSSDLKVMFADVGTMKDTVTKELTYMKLELTKLALIQERLADGKERMDKLDTEILANRKAMHDLRDKQNDWQNRMFDLFADKLTEALAVKSGQDRGTR